MTTQAHEFAVPSVLARPDYEKTILVVEDDRLVRRAACELLRESGFDVLEADSVSAARTLFWFEHRRVHVLLCDAVLPDGSGVELCQRLKAESQDMRVILMSGYPTPTPAHSWDEKTGSYFLAKPYSAKLLIVTLRRIFTDQFRPHDPLLPHPVPHRVENLPG